MDKESARKIVLNTATIVMAFSGAAMFWLHEPWFLILMAPALIILRKYKSETAEEKECLEELETKSMLFFLTLPICIILFLCLLFIAWVVVQNITT